MSRSFGGTLLTIRSPSQTRPSVISSSPATMRRAEVLPQPDGPTRTTSSPSRISRSSPSTALVTSGSLTGTWVGLHNFVAAWDSSNFRTALRNTIVFTLASQVLVIVGAAILAHALLRPFRGRWLLRFLILLPWAAPVALSTIGFLWIFDSQFSVVNWTLVHDLLPGGGHFYLYKPVSWVLAVIDHLPSLP